MKFSIRVLIVQSFFILFLGQCLFASDTLSLSKGMRNTFKFGTSFTISKYFFSYEYALTQKVSVGGMISYALGKFPGYSGTIFTRYYVKNYNRSGFFVEARGSYAHYNPYVYSSYYTDGPPSGGAIRMYEGRHRADIDYWTAGLSAGYKIFCNKRIFFECMGGVHKGKPIFASDDTYFSITSLGRLVQTDLVRDRFAEYGPAFPLHFMINCGILF